MPATMTGRRPKRSETGPQISVATAIATSDSDSMSCATSERTSKPAEIAGRAGESAWSEKGPTAVTAAKSATSGALRGSAPPRAKLILWVSDIRSGPVPL